MSNHKIEIPDTIVLGYGPKDEKLRIPPRELIKMASRFELRNLKAILDAGLCETPEGVRETLDKTELRGAPVLVGDKELRLDHGSRDILKAMDTEQLTSLQVKQLVEERLEEVSKR